MTRTRRTASAESTGNQSAQDRPGISGRSSELDPGTHGATRILVDSHRDGMYGGTGEIANWTALKPYLGEAILAGGLDPTNVGEAISRARPWGVDVSSGSGAQQAKRPAIDSRVSTRGARAGWSPAMSMRTTGRAREQERERVREGYFGAFGGQFVPEVLMPALHELAAAYADASADTSFQRELSRLSKEYVGRPTPVYHAARFSEAIGHGAQVYLKREDLAHTGAHKINNALGQGLLARRMGKQRIIAETGAGQHGVASATVCAMLGLECIVYMGEEDVRRQALNVYRMRLLGAEVRT